jgi:DNA (cytosine-5)-methyltransferase 1
MRELRYIDLFAGCGGLSLGLGLSGWRGFFAIERNPMAFATLKHNLVEQRPHFSWPHWLPYEPHDIDIVMSKHAGRLRKLRGSVDLVAGGPPCQGFSTEGRRRASDSRNKLVHSYLNFVELVRPRMLLFENVQGFTSGFRKASGSRGRPFSDLLLERLHKLGYSDAVGQLVDFSQFGLPQRRKRFIVVGTTIGAAGQFFDELRLQRGNFLAAKGLQQSIGVQAAISDLEKTGQTRPSPDSKGFAAGVYGRTRNRYQEYHRYAVTADLPDSHRFANHTTRTELAFSALVEGAEPNVRLHGEATAAFGIRKRNVTLLDRRNPAPTLMSIPDDFVHYAEPRILTVREYARLQSFPDWYCFRGSYTTGGLRRRNSVPRYTQIANAVPPLFAELAGYVLRSLVADEPIHFRKVPS